MPQNWSEILQRFASRIPAYWLDDAALPLPDDDYIKQSAEWRKMEVASRKVEIGTVIRTAQVNSKPLMLFLLWTWEPSVELRLEIIRGFPREETKEDRATVHRVLVKIFRHETPDAHGKAVREEVEKFLADDQPAQRATLGPTDRPQDALDPALAELNRLRSINPWL